MADLLPVTAASRSVALRFEPDSDLVAGSLLRLTVGPDATATARTVDSSGPTRALATARGLGAGYSRYYEGLADQAFFNTLNFSIASGGGLIDGTADAQAYASGRGDTEARAEAINVALADLSYLDRYGGVLQIGTTASPFAAKARAGSGSILGAASGTSPRRTLDATAIVRGIEGPSTIYGQPNAVVAADSLLELQGPNRLTATASADAVGLEGSEIKAVPFGNGDRTASISGVASSHLSLEGAPSGTVEQLSLNGRAVGIDSSLIYGAPTLNTTITGRGLAVADPAPALAAGLAPQAVALNQLDGIGISNSLLFTNQGNDVIRAFGGVADAGLRSAAGGVAADTAGFDRSGVYTGLGDDMVFGRILNEVEADVNANGDGLLDPAVFLDHSVRDGLEGGFDGLRNSTANTGLGNDLIAGSANGSHLFTEIGNDSIDLDRAKFSSLWGGLGNDVVRVNGTSDHNVLWGGLGNDELGVGSGDGSVLDGGYGQDVTSGGSGMDRFVLSEGGAAILAASSSSFGEQLADAPLWASLNQTQKDNLWETGRLLNGDGNQVVGRVDTIKNFQTGSGGDVLELSSSLAGITQELWDNSGAIYGVDNSGQLQVLEASRDGSNRIGVVVGELADIQKLGVGSPFIAYATDTRQLMLDTDGIWNKGSISMGTVNTTGPGLSHSNLAFGSTTANGLGEAPTAQGGLG